MESGKTKGPEQPATTNKRVLDAHEMAGDRMSGRWGSVKEGDPGEGERLARGSESP